MKANMQTNEPMAWLYIREPAHVSRPELIQHKQSSTSSNKAQLILFVGREIESHGSRDPKQDRKQAWKGEHIVEAIECHSLFLWVDIAAMNSLHHHDEVLRDIGCQSRQP
jgi:hypothetical protein